MGKAINPNRHVPHIPTPLQLANESPVEWLHRSLTNNYHTIEFSKCKTHAPASNLRPREDNHHRPDARNTSESTAHDRNRYNHESKPKYQDKYSERLS